MLLDNHKYPVLIITHADEEEAKRRELAKRANEISSNIRYAIQDTLRYHFKDFDELKEQLQWSLDTKFRFDDSIEKPVKFTIEDDPTDGDYYIVKVDVGHEYIEKALIKYVEPISDLDDDIEDLIDESDLTDIEDFLKRHFGNDWRETDPHLKDVFGIKENINESADELTTVGLGIKLRKDIEKGWSKETCHPSYQSKWSLEYPSIGQCAITAMWLNEKMGWDIYETIVNRSRHFFNKDSNGFIYDLTADQFQDSDINYENCRKREFKDLYRSCKDRYELFKHNLTSVNESIERLDIKQIDKYILNSWGSDKPGEGCIFIHPNGKFINIYPKLEDHEDLCYWLEEQGFDETTGDAEWFVDTFNYVRCRNSLHLCFIELPIKNITRDQLYSLQEWFETKVASDYIDVELPDGQWKKYNLDEYFPEDIIKLIKRYYASGTLYENYSDQKISEINKEDVIKALDECNNSYYMNTSMVMEVCCETLFYEHKIDARYKGRTIYIGEDKIAIVQVSKDGPNMVGMIGYKLLI